MEWPSIAESNPMTRDLPSILRENSSDLALVIGNGINRYGARSTENSWDELLRRVAGSCAPPVKAPPPGTSLTEFYDILELSSEARSANLQEEFCDLLTDWRPEPHHQRVMDWARRHNAPVLTTNFDDVLARSSSGEFQRFRNRGFTDYYPWECYYAPSPLSDPRTGFGVWHINGMAKYHRSVRLGLGHYMGSVMRAREWLHRSGNRLFAGDRHDSWPGRHTWMQVVFGKPLLVAGVGIEENETFLRWLLLERANYFKKFADRRQRAWYVYKPDADNRMEAGKLYFLQAVGFECIAVSSFDEIYGEAAWAG